MSSIALAGAPYLTIDDLADVIFQTESKTWDFLRKGGHMRIYGTLDWPSVLFLSIYESIDQTVSVHGLSFYIASWLREAFPVRRFSS